MAHVLIIDDDPLGRSLLRRILTSIGHSVWESMDGEAGLRDFRARHTDLVICDIMLPGMDGIETIAAIRRDSTQVKILVISGGSVHCVSGDLLRTAVAAGADRKIAKPITPDSLRTALDALLSAA